jgi:hypothetical protein
MAEVPRSAYDMQAAKEEAVDHVRVLGGSDGSFMTSRAGLHGLLNDFPRCVLISSSVVLCR